MKDKDFRRILVVNPFGIGDLLFSTPLFKNLKFFYPNSHITVLVARRSAPVLKNNPNVDSVIPFNRGDFKELKKTSKRRAYRKLFETLGKIAFSRFDFCIDLSLEHRYSIFAKLLGVRTRIGYNYRKRGRFLTDKVDIGGFVGRHVVEYHLSLLRLLGLESRFQNLELFISREEKDWAKDFFKKHSLDERQTFIVMAPGGGKAWGDKAWHKYWPESKFADLADKLQDEKVKVILTGDHIDIPICDNISSRLREKPINICGKVSLRQHFALLDKADIVICNDSGTLHSASALGKKIIALFGPTGEDAYGPYPISEEKVVISKDFSCRPCYSNFRVSRCSYNQRCLVQIGVEEVLDKVKALIA